MTRPIKIYSKAAIERRRLFIDYNCWLAELEMLTSFQTAISPSTPAAPLIVNSTFPDAAHKKLQTHISGGVAGTDYTVSMIVYTDGNQIKRDDIGVRVT